jgi:Tfp pilus assembly protein PilF
MCAGCHQQIARSYSETGMGRSFATADPGKLASVFNGASIDNQPSSMHYSLVSHNGKLFQRRSQIGFRGTETNVVEEQVDYVIGSGNHAHTFLHRNAQGQLLELPVSWYAENSGYLAMSPGFDRHDQEDFHRTIPAECMFCHNAYPSNPDALNSPTVIAQSFPSELPSGIDCQRCHGPGRAHVNAAIAGAEVEKIRNAIVNPAKLDRDRQMDVCMQCHLETSSSHMPNEIRRFDRAVYSYRPGQTLGDYKIYFDPVVNQRNDRFEISHAAYRLRMSACFRKSQMTCLTCHDPHVSYRGSGSAGRYIEICKGCHQSIRHTSNIAQSGDCIDCHMPKRRTDDAVHVVMTDHYIQRLKPDRDLLAPTTEADTAIARAPGIEWYYPPKPANDAKSELYLLLARVKGEDAQPEALAVYQKQLLELSPTEPEFYYELAHAYSKAGKQTEATHWYLEALHRKPVYPQAAKELAASLLDTNRPARAQELLKQAIAKSPADAQLFTDLGILYLHERHLDLAQSTLLHALQLNPTFAEAKNMLGLISVSHKNTREADRWLRAAIRDNPSMAEAHYNLGNLLSSNGDYEQAGYEYRQAINANPDYAAGHHGYGLMLELTHSYDQAAEELARAAQLDAVDPEIHSDFADLLAARGQLAEAQAQYQLALQSTPGSADLRTSLGSVLSAQGKVSEAASQFEEAIRLNPDQFQAHLELSILLFKSGKVAEARIHCRKAAQSPDLDLRNTALSMLGQMGS